MRNSGHCVRQFIGVVIVYALRSGPARLGYLLSFRLPPSAFRLPLAFCLLLSAFCLAPPRAIAQTRPSPSTEARNRMVEEEIVGAGIKNVRVIQAMRDTPRHEFVLPQYRQQAYFDMSLPIGDKQTISGPFVVAYHASLELRADP